MSESTKEFPRAERPVERNAPCPCGSGRKYKKCHGMEVRALAQPAAAPQTGDPATDAMAGMSGAIPPGMNPKMMWEMAKVLRKVPKGQLQKLQTLMQQAMAGKDVSREAQALQASLPPDVQQMLIQMEQQMPQGAAASGGAANESPQTTQEKKGFFSKWRKKESPSTPGSSE